MSSSSDDTAEHRPPLEELIRKHFGPETPRVRVDVGAATHVGKVRRTNEDHYMVVRRRRARDVLLTNLPAGFLPPSQDDAYGLTVADGVGGAAFGEVASQMALRVAWDLTSGAYQWNFKLTDSEMTELREKLWVYGQLIHQALQVQAAADPELRGMATTVTCALTAGFDGIVAHVGDSRAYQVRAGVLYPLTRDHTAAQQLVDLGILDSTAQAAEYLLHALVNCLGGKSDDVQVDTRPFRLADGDRLLLCTDGLTDMVSEEEIARVLAEQAEPQAACDALVERALDHGGRDNVTVVLARYTAAG